MCTVKVFLYYVFLVKYCAEDKQNKFICLVCCIIISLNAQFGMQKLHRMTSAFYLDFFV